jgi:hypothetical protein
MSSFLRCPLIGNTALAAYLAVHVFAGALHHHEAESRPERSPIAYNIEQQFLISSQADNDSDEETCLLCSVLHLAQILPTALHFEAITTPTGEALSATAIIRPHPLQTATHSRGPPLL